MSLSRRYYDELGRDRTPRVEQPTGWAAEREARTRQAGINLGSLIARVSSEIVVPFLEAAQAHKPAAQPPKRRWLSFSRPDTPVEPRAWLMSSADGEPVPVLEWRHETTYRGTNLMTIYPNGSWQYRLREHTHDNAEADGVAGGPVYRERLNFTNASTRADTSLNSLVDVLDGQILYDRIATTVVEYMIENKIQPVEN